MAADPEVPQPIHDQGGEIFTFLGHIEDRLDRIEVQLTRIETEILAAERRSFRQVGSFAGLTDAQRAAEQEWLRIEAAARAALEHKL